MSTSCQFIYQNYALHVYSRFRKIEEVTNWVLIKNSETFYILITGCRQMKLNTEHKHSFYCRMWSRQSLLPSFFLYPSPVFFVYRRNNRNISFLLTSKLTKKGSLVSFLLTTIWGLGSRSQSFRVKPHVLNFNRNFPKNGKKTFHAGFKRWTKCCDCGNE